MVRDVGRKARSLKTREPRRKNTSTSTMALKSKRKRREGREGILKKTRARGPTTGEEAKLAI
jgi:hypothetical protein